MISDKTRIQVILIALAMALMLLLGGWLLIPRSHAAFEYVVNCPADGNGVESELGDAIALANASVGQDSILINPSGAVCVFTMAAPAGDFGTGNVALPLIDDPVTIRALGPGAILERDASVMESFRVLESQADLTLENITVRNGKTAYHVSGGGIYAHQAVTLTNVVLTNNVSYGGGGLYVIGSLTMNEVTISNNETDSDAPSHGGGVWVEGDLTATTITVTGNIAESCACGGDQANGGGIYVGGGAVITGADFRENATVPDFGGGLYVAGDLTLSNSTFYSNTSDINGLGYGGGGAVWVEGRLSMTDAHFIHNRSGGNLGGGAIYLSSGASNSTISNSDFEHNEAEYGGALSSEQDVLITNSRFSGNSAKRGGAALLFEGAIENSLFEDNVAEGNELYDGGGALWVYYDVTIQSSRFVSNTAASGGGVFIVHLPPLGNVSLIINNLWLDNDAGDGAAIYVGFTGDMIESGHTEINHNTIVRRTQSSASALYVDEGTATVINNIITNHTIGISAGPAAEVTSDYNLFHENTILHAGVPSGSNNLTSDPLFIDPANGDYHLQAGSPAIDSGQDLGVSVDLDGVARPQGDGFDRGAYEYVMPVSPNYPNFIPLVVKSQ